VNTIPNLLPYPSGTHCAWYGSSVSGACSYALSPDAPQYLTCVFPLVLPNTPGSILLSFRSWSFVEVSPFWDMHGVQVRELGAPSWTELPLVFNSQFWRQDTRDLSPWIGRVIEMRFFFNAVDSSWNDTEGVYLDDILITVDPQSTPAMSACASDTWPNLCPCSNGGPGRGCASSLSSTGARIAGSGMLHVSSDSFTLHIDGMSDAAATLFQASDFTYSNIPGIAGDGLSCVSGSLVRLVTRFAPGGALDFPTAGDASISTLGFITSGQTRYYAARYRDSAVFCNSPTFNITNTISAYWRP
jgi:hypothetical protein